MKQSYTVKFDRVPPTPEASSFPAGHAPLAMLEIEAPGLASIEEARAKYEQMRLELEEQGYRTAHARIVGPYGEVYSVVPS